MICFKNAYFNYGKKAVLSDFNLNINSGERVCLFGKSGSGKTTVLRIIMGLEHLNSGSFTKESEKISVVFQEDRLLPFKTALQNAAFFSDEQSAKEMLCALGLTEKEQNLYPAELSGGMARRVAIARALCTKGDIYIFDEPFNGLDIENINGAAQLINSITKEKTVVLVAHDEQYAQRLKCKMIYF